jgi:antitoxin component YwqK of YwqJK toxin-antitoxin module
MSDKTIIHKTYYSEEKVSCISEMTQDSVLHGKTSWSDSTNRVYLEEFYIKGKLTKQIAITYHENGKTAAEVEFLKNKEISRKVYSPDGVLTFHCPLNTDKVGKLWYTINDGKRDHLIKNKEDTIEFFADNLPASNLIISTYGAILSKSGKGYIIKSARRYDKVKVYVEYYTDCNLSKRVFLDSLFITVK